MSYRVLLVDDEPAHLELLTVLLGLEDDFEIVGTASDGIAATDLARSLQPDLIVSDIEMPRLSGTDATEGYREAVPEAVVVLMSSRPPADAETAAHRAGADLYIDKGTGVDTTIRLLREAVRAGRVRSDAGSSERNG